MDAPQDRSKALNEHMLSGFAPRADIVAACRHVRFVPLATECSAANYSITSSARARSVGGTSKETIVQASARLDPNCPQTMIR
jgi:hypothetical protein